MCLWMWTMIDDEEGFKRILLLFSSWIIGISIFVLAMTGVIALFFMDPP